MEPIISREFITQELVNSNPAELYDTNKKIVYSLTCPPNAIHSGKIRFSRWNQETIPNKIKREKNSSSLQYIENFYRYESPSSDQVDWYLNFANYDLFSAYGSPLFAQDEMQVTEHPALASLRQALLKEEIELWTAVNGVATPILITGVERRCEVKIDPNPAEDRPYGLYGNNFADASETAIKKAVTILNPPTISNILAMEAPAYGMGKYREQEIKYIVNTAYTGFKAVIYETKDKSSVDTKVVIHTGYWGCGAYGGNRVLMPLLQLISAIAAGVDKVIFHTGPDASGYIKASALLDELIKEGESVETPKLIDQLVKKEFDWGVSDGT